MSAFLFSYTLIATMERTERLLTCLLSCLTDVKSQALSGIHAFSGNDYISSFFRKGKLLIWKFPRKHQGFLPTLAKVGLFSNVTE